MDALHPDVGVESGPRDRPRRGRVGLRPVRQALPGRPVRPVHQPGRPRPHRAGRGRGPAGQHPGLLPHLELRPPHGHRAGRPAGRADPGGLQPDLLHHRWVRGGGVGVEAGPPVLRGHRAAGTEEGDQPEHRLPRRHHGGAVHHRGHRDQVALRAAGARRGQGAQHQLLPGAVLRRRPRGVRPLGGRRHRAGHPVRGARDGGRGLPRAGAERRRLLPAAPGLLPAGARDLRPVRRAHGVRRGHLRLRPAGPLLRGRALRLRAGHRHHGQGTDQRVLAPRGHGRQRPAGGAVPRRARASSTA